MLACKAPDNKAPMAADLVVCRHIQEIKRCDQR